MSVFKRISALIAVLFVVVGFGSISSHEEEAGVEYVDVEKLDSNSDELDGSKLEILMVQQEVKFLSGLIRRYKPKKILEVGVCFGGSSAVILNSIKDDEEAKLYSIDINGEEWVGRVVQASFPELAKTGKWKLFKGNIAAKYLDEIGDGIDFVFLDTMHMNPGEFLDFLMMLPYLKEGAVIVIHDVMLQHLVGGLDHKHAEYLRAMCKKFIQAYFGITDAASLQVQTKFGYPIVSTNCTLLGTIRGKKLIPSYDLPNIGAVKLEKGQRKCLWEYFNLLILPWFYMPGDEHIGIMESHFKKHYDERYVATFKESVAFHKECFAAAEKLAERKDEVKTEEKPVEKRGGWRRLIPWLD